MTANRAAAALARPAAPVESLARSIAISAHAGQTDKSGAAYVLHPARVVAALLESGRSTFGRRGVPADAVLAGAWLHDVVEDCPEWPLARLAGSGLPQQVLAIVDALTHRKGESNLEYYERLCRTDGAADAKRADVGDNADPRRLALIGDAATVARLIRKYRIAAAAIDRFEKEAPGA